MLVVPTSSLYSPSSRLGLSGNTKKSPDVFAGSGHLSTKPERSLENHQRLTTRVDLLQFQQLRIEKMYGSGYGNSILDRQNSSSDLEKYINQLPSGPHSEEANYVYNYFLMHGN